MYWICINEYWKLIWKKNFDLKINNDNVSQIISRDFLIVVWKLSLNIE